MDINSQATIIQWNGQPTIFLKDITSKKAMLIPITESDIKTRRFLIDAWVNAKIQNEGLSATAEQINGKWKITIDDTKNAIQETDMD
jgi:hypothetical protein